MLCCPQATSQHYHHSNIYNWAFEVLGGVQADLEMPINRLRWFLKVEINFWWGHLTPILISQRLMANRRKFPGRFDHTARSPTAEAPDQRHQLCAGPPLQKSPGKLWHWHNCFVREISHTPTAKMQTGVGPRSLLMVHKVTGFIP